MQSTKYNPTYIEDEKGMLGGHNFGRAVTRKFGGLFVPPQIPAHSPIDLTTCSFQNEDMLDARAVFDSSVHDHLERDGLPTSLSLVSGNHNT